MAYIGHTRRSFQNNVIVEVTRQVYVFGSSFKSDSRSIGTMYLGILVEVSEVYTVYLGKL